MNQTISRNELKEKMDCGVTLQLVEALSEESFWKQHLPGAINLPPAQAKELASRRLPNKDADIVVYCASSTCNASHDVAQELKAQGYRNVKRYAERKQDWVDAGLPTQTKGHAAAR